MLNIIPKIESNDLTLTNVFNDFYSVPDFQREFVWVDEHVEKLLNDTYDEFYDETKNLIGGNSEYFVGSIVVAMNNTGVFDLIDGQQRMTTFFLTLCAIRDYIASQGAAPPKRLENLISDFSSNTITGEDIHRQRLTLQYEESDGVLEKIAKQDANIDALRGTSKGTTSVNNLLNAYETICVFLQTHFEILPRLEEQADVDSQQESRNLTVAKLQEFYAALTNRVKLIRIVTPNLNDALKIFETINDRGVGLNAMDLLKNLLFIKTPDKDYPKLKAEWEKLIKTLGNREKPLRFLRYYILANYELNTRRELREDEIYDWFVRNSNIVGLDTAPLNFMAELVNTSHAYINFLNKKNVDNSHNRYLVNIAAIGGASVRQHLILLMAGKHLNVDLFTELTRQLENLFFSYIITREPTKNFERVFSQWASIVRNIKTDIELKDFLETYLYPDLRRRVDRVDFSFDQLSLGGIQKYRMKYVLAKLVQYIEEAAWENPEDSNIENYLQSSVHIEHILPQTPTQVQREAFDKTDEYDLWVNKIGNLTLLPKGANISASNGDYELKKNVYTSPASRYILTQSLVEKPKLGKKTRFDAAVAELEAFETWNSESIEKRQGMLKRLARQVWLADITGR